MGLFDEPKIDGHCHILDPDRFPYAPDVAYRPSGQEVGTLAQYLQVMGAYGIHHALLVGPNSGYNLDNSCLLDALAQGKGRFKGIAVLPNDTPLATLRVLREAGVVGVAWNVALMGPGHYAQAGALLRHMADLDMLLSLQVEHNQLLAMQDLVARSGVRVLIDHCGRPTPGQGVDQPGFQTLLQWAGTGRVAVKLSGYAKFSAEGPPYADALPFLQALLDHYSLDACLWASDWPFLKAPQRQDVGVLLRTVEHLLAHTGDRQRLWWDTPRRWLGF